MDRPPLSSGARSQENFTVRRNALRLSEVRVGGRIFREYVDGRTLREIAHELNKDRMPSPRGRADRDTPSNKPEAIFCP
jgi:hypothetical protein